MSVLHKTRPEVLLASSRKWGFGRSGRPAPEREPQLQFVPDRLLRVIKFGGTSVADAASILQAATIAKQLSHECRLVVVVSAMRGVTDKLVEAAQLSAAGKADLVQEIFSSIRERHQQAAEKLLASPADRDRTHEEIARMLGQGIRRCDQVRERRALTLEALDFISGLGECLSAPLFAAALAELGIRSEAIAATKLIVTDRKFGGAEPNMRLTRKQSLPRLGNLLSRHIVPVVTGFIGATPERVPTTLGRNGSDFSATIVAAAIDADEVIIWTDVNGVLSADPRLVPTARTIAELSYREGSELARLGAKVLHYKTLSVLESSGTPVWIRSTFAPEKRGTRITPGIRLCGGGVAMTALREISLVRGTLPRAVRSRKAVKRALHALADETNSLVLPGSAGQFSVVVRAPEASRTIKSFKRKLRPNARRSACKTSVTEELALIAMVSDDAVALSDTFSRVSDALTKQNIAVLLASRSAESGSFSLVVHQADFSCALATAHREIE